jgi:aryl-alcohol dehydrogenase-like predicted oxidoreductase
MKYERIGSSGLEVSRLCLGSMMFGDQTSEADSVEIIAAAKDAGINFIDTANSYSKGGSEEILGRALKRQRDDWVLATKVGSPMSKAVGENRLSRKRIMTEAERSLSRLQTDAIDIYYLHRDDLDIPLEEPVGAMGDLIRQGKIRYWGFSNFDGWRVGELVRVADALGVPRPTVVQPLYNAMNRMVEQELLPACAHYGIGVVPYSPLARGVLTGKYTPDEAPPPDTRAGRKDARILESEFRPESLKLAQKVKVHAEARGITAGQFAFAWVLNNRLVNAVIGGPRTMAHWRDYLGALDYTFTAEDEAFIDDLVIPGFSSTPFFGDVKLPARGRTPRT